jgi:TRAP transporter TAXI family solute receptor
MALRRLSWHDALIVGVPTLIVVVAAFWFAALHMRPAPPDHLVMATGPAGGAYEIFARRYRDYLAHYGVTLTLVASPGSVENLAKLADGSADVAFVQGGVAAGAVPRDADRDDDEDTPIQSLGALYPEPLWLFERAAGERRGDARARNIATLAGKRIAVGPEGSGTRALALELLRRSGVDAARATLVPITGDAAAHAVEGGDVDALFLIAGPSAPQVRELLNSRDVRPQSLVHAQAFARQLEFVRPLTLPRGLIDIAADIPDHDLDTVAVTANLLVRNDLHPALMYLLLDAATAIHGGATLLADAGTYPNGLHQDVPLASEAERFYRQGKPFLKRYLPYWLANLIDRMLVLLIPIVAVLFPAFKLLPALYTYRLRARITDGYAKLRALEEELDRTPVQGRVDDYVARLDAIEQHVNHLHLPSWFAREAYELRAAIDLIRERLGQPGTKAVPALRGS